MPDHTSRFLGHFLGCPHDAWKPFDIGFDKGWCCARCKREVDTRCANGHHTTCDRRGDRGSFRCVVACGAAPRAVRVSDVYLDT